MILDQKAAQIAHISLVYDFYDVRKIWLGQQQSCYDSKYVIEVAMLWHK